MASKENELPSTSNNTNSGIQTNIVHVSFPSGKKYKIPHVFDAMEEFGEIVSVSVCGNGFDVQFKSVISGFNDWEVKINGDCAKIAPGSRRGSPDGDSNPATPPAQQPPTPSPPTSYWVDDNPDCTTPRYLSRKEHKNDTLLIKCLIKSAKSSTKKRNI